MDTLNLDRMAEEIRLLESKPIDLPAIENHLNNCADLILDEKAIIYSWFMPKPIIKDRELPDLIKKDTSYLKLQSMVNAWRSEQYHRYIKHLIIAFIIKGQTVHRITRRLNENIVCGITGKELFGTEDINVTNDNIGITNSVNNQTDQVISIEAIYLLGNLFNFLNKIEPNFIAKRQ